jgi:DNA polymerase
MSAGAPTGGFTGDPRREALLYVEWAREAAGPLAWRDPEPARPPEAGTARADAALPEAGPAEEGSPLERIARRIAACRRCGLAETRTRTVPGEGSARPRLMVIGEAPGADEDASGRPFVGRAGQLLTRMLAAIGLSREDVFIANVLKCRPPGNRPPAPDEVASCKPYLQEQVALLEPPLILALGNHAVRALLAADRGISHVRGRLQRTPEGWRVMPTYHPSYLLRNPAAKKEVWEDLKKVAAELGLEIPRAGGGEPGG